ncbi:MAG TPA: DUF4388 domain-containing protein [Thermoanaerobaculia bacterium]|nr:DUF4388 domain-containing protein [Thermoanaerobaculia bacterium]
MAVEGTLDLFKLPEILQLISQQQKTGILTVQGQQDIVAISFLNGRIVAADALNQTLEQGLADVLVREGLLSAPEFARASAEHQSSGARLLDVLVERRFVERPQLLHALRLQTYRLLQQLLRWSEGDFKFYSGDEVSYEEGFQPISVEDLLINSLPEVPPPQPPAPPPGPRPVPPVAAVPSPAAPPATRIAAPVPEEHPAAVRPGPRPVPSAPAAAPAVPSPAPRPVAVPRPAAAAVAVPPDLDATGGSFRRMKVEAPAAAPAAQGLTGKLLGALLAALLLAVLWASPVSMLLPFPWEDGDRAALIRDQREALYLKIDRAAKTYFLLKGSFPDRLGELVEMGLLAEADLEDPLGLPLEYTPGEESYALVPVRNGKPVPEAEANEAITGNFLLDPEFVSVSPESAAAPLVLLD